jgi:outer membrane protein assembly factor BamB
MAGEGLQKEAWRFEAGAGVQSIAAAGDSDAVAVACEDRQIIVLDGTGKVTGTFKAGKALRRVRVDRLGMTFAALSGEAVIYAFSASGDLEWRVELGGPVVDFSLCQLAEQLAAVSEEGWLYLYSQATRERRVAPVGWPMSSVVIAQTDPLRVVVANEEGRVAFLNEEAKALWEEDLGRPTGPLAVSRGAEVVAVPAGDRGVVLYRFSGGEIAAIDAGEPVRKADITVKGSLIAVETVSGRLALYEGEGELKWEHALDAPPVDWGLGRSGTLISVGVAGGDVLGFQTGGAPIPVAEAPAAQEAAPEQPAEPALSPEETEERVKRVLAARRGAFEPAEGVEQGGAEESSNFDVDLVDYMEVEEALDAGEGAPAGVEEAGAAPKAAPPKKGLVRWKKKLPEDVLSTDETHFRLSTDGENAIFLFTDGRIVVLDAAGNWALQSRSTMPAVLVPRHVGSAVGAWCARELILLDLPADEARAILLGRRNIKHVAGSANMSLFSCIDAADKLRTFVGDADTPTWKKAIEGGVTGLEVSPDGRTILVPDSTGRFRYFDSRGNLVRKFRFAEPGDHKVLALGDDFTVFATPAGRVTVLDSSGGELMVRRVFRTLTGAEVLGNCFAVYGEDGECAVIDPREDMVWDFRPPPGRVRVRKPSNMDPLVVHVLNEIVTVFMGYKRKLDVAWRYSCSGDIVAFDADQEGRTVVVLADQKVYRLGAE